MGQLGDGKKHLLGPGLIWNFISVDIIYLQK